MSISTPIVERTVATESEPANDLLIPDACPSQDNWLRLIYELAWTQYSHEDELRHNKNTLYITIQTALFALLPATVAFSLGSANKGLSEVAPYVLGILFIGTAILGHIVNRYWENVVRSGRSWLYLRYATARAIEHQLGLSEFGLAGMEHRWDQYCKVNKPTSLDERCYFPFKEIPDLQDVGLYPKPPIGESHAALGIVRALNWIWLFVGAAGLVMILVQTGLSALAFSLV